MTRPLHDEDNDDALRAEQRRMEEKLLRADRMASIGALVAGVAHEINNPLAIVLANLDLLAHLAIPPSGPAPRLDSAEIQETLRDAREAADRVRVIVAGLKTLSRSDELERGPVDLHRMLDFSIKMAWNEIRHRARLVKAYGPVPAVHGNEARLGQVFLNLLINAAQAIPEGHAGENEIRISTQRGPDDSVTVEIRDSGLGMPAEVIARIFDPFFTSKPVGAGTGLGLAICDTIVRSHGGEITVSSAVGQGSTFVVRLPASDGVPSYLQRATPVIAVARRARVLVIDDEPAIGIALRRTLQDDHDVDAVTSARSALDLLDAGRRFDLILCDMMMPEQTGEGLHAELAGKLPDQAERMVFLTGGAFTPGARAFLDRVNNVCLEKPFDGDAVRALCARMIR
jgi:nitrogen-specific signal transduction histidine kinase